jgi:regulator of nucleoside diphosphate kinase
MTRTDRAVRTEPPAIHISETEYTVIEQLAMRMESDAPELSDLIIREIDRAHLHASADMPADVVRIGSEVTFLDETSGTTKTVQMVLPRDADIAEGRISVMTHIGAGLIGMPAGGRIEWPGRDGRSRLLKILAVAQRG